MFRLLCTAEFDDEWTKKFQQIVEMDREGFSLDKDPKKRMNQQQITKALKGYDIHISGYEQLTKDVLYKEPDLKLILSVRDGPRENIDVDACTDLGIPVLFSSGRCERSVPEYTFLAMMMLAKPVERVSKIIRKEKWTKENDLKLRRINEGSTEMAGKTVGIIGLGRNGMGLAVRCKAFQMKILGYDPYIKEEMAAEQGIELTSLEELFRESDYVVVLARVTEETKRMVTRELIWSLKKDACFINTARAALVDNDALLDALEEDRIKAALDVFDQEPIPTASRVYSISEDRLLLTPHLAGVSIERIAYQSEKLYDALVKYMNGEMPENVANPEVFETEEYKQRGALIVKGV